MLLMTSTPLQLLLLLSECAMQIDSLLLKLQSCRQTLKVTLKTLRTKNLNCLGNWGGGGGGGYIISQHLDTSELTDWPSS